MSALNATSFNSRRTAAETAAMFYQLAEPQHGDDYLMIDFLEGWVLKNRDSPGPSKLRRHDEVCKRIAAIRTSSQNLRTQLLAAYDDRIALIEILLERIQAWHSFYVKFDPDSDTQREEETNFVADFPNLIRFFKIFTDNTDEDVGRVINVTGYSVGRYIDGTSTPKAKVRPTILFALKEALILKRRELGGARDRAAPPKAPDDIVDPMPACGEERHPKATKPRKRV